MERSILHCDLNNFYATAECVNDPSLSGKYVAVCGDPSQRHGIVLAKNQPAKLCGVKTGDVIWEAKLKCPELVCVQPHFELYQKYSRMVKEIYYAYTDFVESYGMDECWLDVTHSGVKGSASCIADKLRKEVKQATGLTISVGVSFNKIFAKLGSDMKKPDATTIISRDNYRTKIYNLPVEDLLMIGKATKRHLNSINIHTIGQLAFADENLLKARFGINGLKLKKYAQGQDDSPVLQVNSQQDIKSVGQSCTPDEDITTYEKANAVALSLMEMVSSRLRAYGLCAKTVGIWLRSSFLTSFVRQSQLETPTSSTQDIYPYIHDLIRANWNPNINPPLRSIGVSVSKLSPVKDIQISIFNQNLIKNDNLERSVDKIRNKYGYTAIQRAATMNCIDRVAITGKDEDILPFRNKGVELTTE